MGRRSTILVRWHAPDGRSGPALKTVKGAVKSAVHARYSKPEGSVSVRFCIRSALSLWPLLEAEGWSIKKIGKRSK